jgi:UDP-N-acetylmuramoyl-L-alanyl-D-glutamate--2,6-diaminopimelate ligase
VSGYPRPRRVNAVALPVLAAAAGASDPGPGASDQGLGAVTVTGVTHASGLVRPGDLYAALPGARRHGAEFAAAAVAAGAVAALTDPAGAALIGPAAVPVLAVADPRAVLGEVASIVYGRPTTTLPVIGLTGTAGKTTTSYLVESGLRAAGHTTCLIGTVETRVADEVVDSERTTPEATDLHGLFAAAVERGVTAVVMEVSSHALAYGRVGGVRFAVGGYTNFGLDHLDFHADVEEYFAAKARLFDGRCAVEILNADDQALAVLRKAATVTYSAAGDPTATWHATGIVPDGYGQRFTARGPAGTTIPAGVALPGRHNVANALLALACLTAVGVDPAVAAAGVAACPGVPGRLERVTAPGPVLGVVDYGHKPDAIVEALGALRRVVGDRGRIIAVLGAGGDRDRAKRPLMGAAAAGGADVVIVTDDNPRTEDPSGIRAAVRAGAQRAAGAGVEVVERAGRREAIAEAVRRAVDGDAVVLLGKGHERDQEIAGVLHPFDDRVELAAALSRRFGSRARRSGRRFAPTEANA